MSRLQIPKWKQRAIDAKAKAAAAEVAARHKAFWDAVQARRQPRQINFEDLPA